MYVVEFYQVSSERKRFFHIDRSVFLILVDQDPRRHSKAEVNALPILISLSENLMVDVDKWRRINLLLLREKKRDDRSTRKMEYYQVVSPG